jgi:uncharacterized repeat protein (TIGR01451 family)
MAKIKFHIFYLSVFACISFFPRESLAQFFNWGGSFGGAEITSTSYFGHDQIHDIAVDKEGSIYFAGDYVGPGDFDPGSGIFSLPFPPVIKRIDASFFLKLDSTGNFQWAFPILRSDSLWYSHINLIVGQDNFIYATGSFGGDAVDFDPGPGLDTISAQPYGDVFIMKISPQGDLEWVRTFGVPVPYLFYFLTEVGGDIAMDSRGDLVIAGHFRGTIDFDPGPGVFNLTSGDSIVQDIFLLKLDTGGNFIWAKKADGKFSSPSVGPWYRNLELKTDNWDNLFLAGQFAGIVDLDFGPGVQLFSSGPGGAPVSFLIKMDSLANFLWARSWEQLKFNSIDEFSVLANGSVVMRGSFQDSLDFDPGPGIHMLYAPTSTPPFVHDAGYVLKLNSAGNFVFAKAIGNLWSRGGISTNDQGNILISGQFKAPFDMDPGPGIFMLGGTGDVGYSLLLNSSGEFLYAQELGSFVNDVYLLDNNEMFAAGMFSDTIDLDIGPFYFNVIQQPEVGSFDLFIQKMTLDTCLSRSLVFDSVKSVGCFSTGYVSIHAENGIPPYQYEWNTIPPTFAPQAQIDSAGLYTVIVMDSSGCIRSSSILMDGPDYGNNFDLKINLNAQDFRPGFQNIIKLDAYNDGCLSVDGQLNLVLPSMVNFDSASPSPSPFIGDTLSWNFTNLIYDGGHLKPTVYLTLNPSATLGSTLCLETYITPFLLDLDTVNNKKKYCFLVLGSFDPNDKKVYPPGKCESFYVLENTTLTYTIRFQNTGTATAINIKIKDQLDQNLDINSLRVVGSSHAPLYSSILPGGVLEFRLDSILLPDSVSDEVHSHGYIMYEVKPKLGAGPGSKIENEANIYFDFNSPVETNTVLSTITNNIPIVDASVIKTGRILVAQATGSSYQWIVCDSGFVLPTDTQQVFIPSIPGTYAVIVTKNKCSEISDCFFVNPLGLKNSFLQEVSVRPNPNSGKFILNLGYKFQDIELRMKDLSGKEVFREEFQNQEIMELELDVPPGMYIASLLVDGGTATFKILVK